MSVTGTQFCTSNKAIILYVILWRSGTWSLVQQLRMVENGVLRREFGPKRDEKASY